MRPGRCTPGPVSDHCVPRTQLITADKPQVSQSTPTLIIRLLIISAHQCHPPVPISATQQLHLSVSIIAAYQCSIISASSSMPSSVASSVQAIGVHQCFLSVLPIGAASSTHIS
ncbi:unnamed protein product, partial [Staurois parvus]